MAEFLVIKETKDAGVGSAAANEYLINPAAISYVLFHTVNAGPPEEGRTLTSASVHLIGEKDALTAVRDAAQLGTIRDAIAKLSH
jgi:hypothetical protein